MQFKDFLNENLTELIQFIEEHAEAVYDLNDISLQHYEFIDLPEQFSWLLRKGEGVLYYATQTIKGGELLVTSNLCYGIDYFREKIMNRNI